MPDDSSHLTITQATEMTEELYQACQRLVPQLTSKIPHPHGRSLPSCCPQDHQLCI